MYLYEICHAFFKPDLRSNDYTNASAVSLIRWCMRIFLLSALLTFNLLLFGKDSHSQGLDQVIISLNVKDATLKQVLNKIGKQTSFHFTYRSDDIRKVKDITYAQDKVSLAKALSDLLQNTGLRYEEMDKNILIMQTENPVADVVRARVEEQLLLEREDRRVEVPGDRQRAARRPQGANRGYVRHSSKGLKTQHFTASMVRLPG